MNLIAFDPGEQTGYAKGSLADGVLSVSDYGWDRWVDCAFKFRRGAEKFSVCVYESWKLTALGAKTLRGSDMPWSQFIGMMKMISMDNQIQMHVQEPKDKYWLDAILGTAWLPKGSVEHHRDAIRHLAIYGIREKGVHTIELGSKTVEVPSAVVSGGSDDGLPELQLPSV